MEFKCRGILLDKDREKTLSNFKEVRNEGKDRLRKHLRHDHK